MKISTQTKDVTLRAKDGLVRVAEYDVVGPVRVMEHLVLVEIGHVFAGNGRVPEPISTAVKRMLVNPRGS